MITLTRLQQDLRSEVYEIGNEDNIFGRLFVFFSHDYLYLDGYLYLNIEEDLTEEKTDELADEIIYHYLNYLCPIDYGQDYTSFEVYIIRKGESYLIELEDDYEDDYNEESGIEKCEECE
ncbi:hypothetical protein BBF96_06810 [Anoxybacter fermentans]|uniref:Uncharacterized protein n=1 Tax=Anoxybacter fermentans TaxID=1323375 RepID=A0A3Q9HQ16_9FIRM|nr:hypothetical protein [Anoxybacter fermentans]AZR73120.1 hypothetical protein BBF96_06810 [Anoxybacter fermentans]